MTDRGAMNKIRFTATYMWPGSFLNETTTVEIHEGTPEAAIAVMPDTTWHGFHAFGFEITETILKRFVSDDSEERWLSTRRIRVGRWYFGETMGVDDVTAMNAGGEYDILLANMRGNDWPTVVRTIAGNFQPVEDGDVVLPVSEHPYHALETRS